MHKLHSLDCGWYIKHSGQIIFFYISKQILLTEPSKNIAFCISQGLSLLQGDHFGQLFLKYKKDKYLYKSFIEQLLAYSYPNGEENSEEAFPYNVIFDELLIAQEDLLPTEDGGLGPGTEGSGARVHSCQHLLLGSFGNSSHDLISGLRSRRQTS